MVFFNNESECKNPNRKETVFYIMHSLLTDISFRNLNSKQLALLSAQQWSKVAVYPPCVLSNRLSTEQPASRICLGDVTHCLVSSFGRDLNCEHARGLTRLSINTISEHPASVQTPTETISSCGLDWCTTEGYLCDSFSIKTWWSSLTDTSSLYRLTNQLCIWICLSPLIESISI